MRYRSTLVLVRGKTFPALVGCRLSTTTAGEADRYKTFEMFGVKTKIYSTATQWLLLKLQGW